MPKLDLHTHSIASKDGGLTESQVKNILETNILDQIAVTDHNEVFFAQKMQDIYGPRIIVGEEIMTSSGEIVGLFLNRKIEAAQSLEATISEIKDMGGLVYVPHPLEKRRKGLSSKSITDNAQNIDIIELHNGRSLDSYKIKIATLADRHSFVCAASSDAHGQFGIGRTYTETDKLVDATNLSTQLSSARLRYEITGFMGFMEPSVNRLRK